MDAEILLSFIFEVVFHGRSSLMGGHLPLEVVLILSFHNIWLGLLSLSFKFGKDHVLWRSPSIGGRLPLEVVFHWRSSSIGGRLH